MVLPKSTTLFNKYETKFTSQKHIQNVFSKNVTHKRHPPQKNVPIHEYRYRTQYVVENIHFLANDAPSLSRSLFYVLSFSYVRRSSVAIVIPFRYFIPYSLFETNLNIRHRLSKKHAHQNDFKQIDLDCNETKRMVETIKPTTEIVGKSHFTSFIRPNFSSLETKEKIKNKINLNNIIDLPVW